MPRDRSPASWSLLIGLLAAGSTAAAQSDGLPSALPTPPGLTSPSPANLAIDIDSTLVNQPTTGPQGLPINLATALQLAGARPLDIAAALARVDEAVGLLVQARALKIPNLNGGVGYYRHDGTNQNLFTGQSFQKGTNGLLVGGGPTINLGVTDAIFAPLAARRFLRAREADVQASRNNVLNMVAQYYFSVQEAKGRLVGAEATIVRSERLVRFAEGQAPSLIAPLEVNRARAQLENVRQFRETALRDWRVYSAQLAEVLLLEPTTLLDPIEPPFLRVALIPDDCPVAELVVTALRSRPEIASQRESLFLAQKNLQREKARPLLPNIVITTPGTANAGVLGAGQFYTGPNDSIIGQGGRVDLAVAAYWQVQNGGLGNVGLIKQSKAVALQADIEVTRTLYRVRSEVGQALGRLQTSAARVPRAEAEVREAITSAEKNFVGLRETTRSSGELLNVVIRPQEVVAALQALSIAFQDYASAVGEFNRSQFELYRALGQPAQYVTSLRKPVPGQLPASSPPPGPPATPPPAPAAR